MLAARHDVVVPDVLDARIHVLGTRSIAPRVDYIVRAAIRPFFEIKRGVISHQIGHPAHFRHKRNFICRNARLLQFLVHQRPQAAQVEAAELGGLQYCLESIVAVVYRSRSSLTRVAPDAIASVERMRLEPILIRHESAHIDAAVLVVLPK